jgi:hypothetical protein
LNREAFPSPLTPVRGIDDIYLLTIGLDGKGSYAAYIAISYKPAHSWQNNFGIVAFGV